MLFLRYSDRLRALVGLRLDRRLQGRVGESDILQETFLDASRSFPHYRDGACRSFYVWLRCIAERRIIDLHRRHLGAKARDAGREIALDDPFSPLAVSGDVPFELAGDQPTGSQVLIREEMSSQIDDALARMDPVDREVIALRHFEELTNIEAAEVLGIEPKAASHRYVRACERLKEMLSRLSDFQADGGAGA